MTAPRSRRPAGIATEFAILVARQFSRHLDWSLASLDELDAVCADLLAMARPPPGGWNCGGI